VIARAAACALALALAEPARAAPPAQATCPNAAYANPVKAPERLVARVARALRVDDDAARNAAFVRCDDGTLLACYVGANLDCFKANTRRTLPGATAWCRDHPGSASIPMFATGHATVYAWSCTGPRAVAGRRIVEVDAKGYIARNWKVVR
jgi:hypothetical protein